MLVAALWALLGSLGPEPAGGQSGGGTFLEVETRFIDAPEAFQDLVIFRPQAPPGCVSWELSVTDKEGATVQRFRSRSELPRRVLWFGIGLDGQAIPDGFYRARLLVRWADGQQTESGDARFSFLTPPVLSGLEKRRVSIHEDEGKFVVRLPDVIFASGEDRLSPSAEPALKDLASFLKAHPERPIVVLGFTDDTGIPEYNQGLSERRARRVYLSLIERGIPPGRLGHKGRGSRDPLASNDDPAGRALNRRVEVWMSKLHVVGR